jgi:alkylation response protein AidB-like acyl-CoA dehydrogenase
MATVSSPSPAAPAATRKGGSWLIEDVTAADVLTPERLSDEHRLIAATAAEFVEKEVAPARDALEAKDWKRARLLVRRAGELGLLGTDVPEAFGGLALDTRSAR